MPGPVLITAFEPFDGRSSNTSMRVLARIDAEPPEDVTTRVLPVAFSDLRKTIPALLRQVQPRRWLLLGEDPLGQALRCERVAKNRVDRTLRDNLGRISRTPTAVRGGPDAYFTTLDPEWLRAHFLGHGIPADLSDSAGAYACNLAFYLALHHARRTGRTTEVGFLHVPRHYRRTGHSIEELRTALETLVDRLRGEEAPQAGRLQGEARV